MPALDSGGVAGGRISVVIVNYRTPDLAVAAVRSVAGERERLPRLRAVVVDGGSGDGSAERLAERLAGEASEGWARLLPLPINGGFGWANNQAILTELSRPDPPDFILLLNPDAAVMPGAIAALAGHLVAHPKAGAAGAQLIDQHGVAQSSAHHFPSILGEFVRATRTGAVRRLLGSAGDVLPIAERPCRADWVSGASVMLRSAALRETGLFDNGFFLYFEEVELMWRLRQAGWETWHVPAAQVRHIEAASTGVTHAAARMPSYWFQSQRRFFALTRGRAGAVAALAAWSAGHLIWLARKALRLGGGPRSPGIGRDRLRHGWPSRADAAPAPTRADAPPGTPPAWMRGRQRCSPSAVGREKRLRPARRAGPSLQTQDVGILPVGEALDWNQLEALATQAAPDDHSERFISQFRHALSHRRDARAGMGEEKLGRLHDDRGTARPQRLEHPEDDLVLEPLDVDIDQGRR